MKIIFLDIDGVLNNANWYKTEEFKAISDQEDRCHFDPKCISNLNTIIDQTHAKIVISSSWRMLKQLEELKTLFHQVGITGEIIGVTGVLHYKDTFQPAPRGLEILKWIHDNPEKLQTYAILDDDRDMLDIQEKYFFNVDSNVGLTTEMAKEIINFLNNSNT